MAHDPDLCAQVVARMFGKAESEKKLPEVLTVQEIRSILNELPLQHRTLVFLFACIWPTSLMGTMPVQLVVELT
jgi:hypothetical protein